MTAQANISAGFQDPRERVPAFLENAGIFFSRYGLVVILALIGALKFTTAAFRARVALWQFGSDRDIPTHNQLPIHDARCAPIGPWRSDPWRCRTVPSQRPRFAWSLFLDSGRGVASLVFKEFTTRSMKTRQSRDHSPFESWKL
jgi:hypothetical protein